jgi:hypothetical protein
MRVWKPAGAKLRLVCGVVSEWRLSRKSKLFRVRVGTARTLRVDRLCRSTRNVGAKLQARAKRVLRLRKILQLSGLVGTMVGLIENNNYVRDETSTLRCVGYIWNEPFCCAACMKVGLRSHGTRVKIHTKHTGVSRECVGLSITHHSDLLTMGIKTRRVMTRTAWYYVNVTKKQKFSVEEIWLVISLRLTNSTLVTWIKYLYSRLALSLASDT